MTFGKCTSVFNWFWLSLQKGYFIFFYLIAQFNVWTPSWWDVTFLIWGKVMNKTVGIERLQLFHTIALLHTHTTKSYDLESKKVVSRGRKFPSQTSQSDFGFHTQPL